MTARAPRLRLATADGRRVGRVGEAKRLAAQPATDAARAARLVAEIYAVGVQVLAAALRAEEAAEATYRAACRDDGLTTRALAREATIEVGYSAKRLSNLLTLIESVSGGQP